jgi:hypothetical protein
MSFFFFSFLFYVCDWFFSLPHSFASTYILKRTHYYRWVKESSIIIIVIIMFIIIIIIVVI